MPHETGTFPLKWDPRRQANFARLALEFFPSSGLSPGKHPFVRWRTVYTVWRLKAFGA